MLQRKRDGSRGLAFVVAEFVVAISFVLCDWDLVLQEVVKWRLIGCRGVSTCSGTLGTREAWTCDDTRLMGDVRLSRLSGTVAGRGLACQRETPGSLNLRDEERNNTTIYAPSFNMGPAELSTSF